jgi:hypothetical protein
MEQEQKNRRLPGNNKLTTAQKYVEQYGKTEAQQGE